MGEGMPARTEMKGHLDALQDDLAGLVFGQGFDLMPISAVPVLGAFHDLAKKPDNGLSPGFLAC